MFRGVEYLIKLEEGQDEQAIIMNAKGLKETIAPEMEDRITRLDKPAKNLSRIYNN